jgi:hypothetical protein
MNNSESQETEPAAPAQTAPDGSVVSLPQWIAVTRLSLAEIGAMVCIASSETQACSHPKMLKQRLASADMRNALNGLRKKGVFARKDIPGGARKWVFDLEVVKPD